MQMLSNLTSYANSRQYGFLCQGFNIVSQKMLAYSCKVEPSILECMIMQCFMEEVETEYVHLTPLWEC